MRRGLYRGSVECFCAGIVQSNTVQDCIIFCGCSLVEEEHNLVVFNHEETVS